MKNLVPLLVTEQSAARLCDMRVSEFRQLVKDGHLPQGREIVPGLYRWPVRDLQSIIDGTASAGEGEVQW
jgi:predicted DNA-binding transcriptional regulator AlpA